MRVIRPSSRLPLSSGRRLPSAPHCDAAASRLSHILFTNHNTSSTELKSKNKRQKEEENSGVVVWCLVIDSVHKALLGNAAGTPALVVMFVPSSKPSSAEQKLCPHHLSMLLTKNPTLTD